MVHVTQTLQYSKALMTLLLQALVSAAPAAIMDITSKVRLAKSGPAPSENMVVSDFAEATFTGYSPYTLAAVDGPVNLRTGGQGMEKAINFTATADPSPAETITHVYITDSAGTVLLAAEQLPTPCPISRAADTLRLELVLAPSSIGRGDTAA